MISLIQLEYIIAVDTYRHFAKERLLDLLAEHLQKVVPPQLQNHERGLVVEWR